MTSETHILRVGGIFFKSKDPEGLQKWYMENLGFLHQTPFYDDDTAITFKWKTFTGENHCTVWAPFPADTEYFEPSKKYLMINYVVRDIEGLLGKLESKGIHEINKLRRYEYGKFVTIMDPEGNKIELWEPDNKFFSSKYLS